MTILTDGGLSPWGVGANYCQTEQKKEMMMAKLIPMRIFFLRKSWFIVNFWLNFIL